MSLFLLYFFAPRGAQHESLSPPPKQYKPPSITPNSLYPSLVPKAQPKGMPWEETSTGISSGCSWHRHAWAEQGAAGCGQSGAGGALVSPWGPAPSCCLPPPAPGAKTPREMPPGMGVLLKGRTQGSVGGLRTSHPPRDPPKPHLETPPGNIPDLFSSSPQAAAPAARRDVPSARRAASARAPPLPSAAAANKDPWLHIWGGLNIWGAEEE